MDHAAVGVEGRDRVPGLQAGHRRRGGRRRATRLAARGEGRAGDQRRLVARRLRPRDAALVRRHRRGHAAGRRALQGRRRRRRADPGQRPHPDPRRFGAHRGDPPQGGARQRRRRVRVRDRGHRQPHAGTAVGDHAARRRARGALHRRARHRRQRQRRRDRQGRLVGGDPEGRRAGDQRPRQDRRWRCVDLRRDRPTARGRVQARPGRPLRALRPRDLPAVDRGAARRAGWCSPRCRRRQTGPGFSVRGIGLLYGSNRTTDPDAFLAGIATGDLDAVLFPDDPIGKAAQYLAALERLFPTRAGRRGDRPVGAVLRTRRADHVRPGGDPRLPRIVAGPGLPGGPVRGRHPCARGG